MTTQANDLKKAIEINGLNFFYGATRSLRDINLNIFDKKVTAFIGPSGCGKSTLLRTLNRMYDLYPGQRAEGKIIYNGKNILDGDQDINLLRAKVGMVFRSRRRFRCRCMTISLSACVCMKTCPKVKWMSVLNGR
jgi:phosphate transport system ATP-binding protein